MFDAQVEATLEGANQARDEAREASMKWYLHISNLLSSNSLYFSAGCHSYNMMEMDRWKERELARDEVSELHSFL